MAHNRSGGVRLLHSYGFELLLRRACMNKHRRRRCLHRDGECHARACMRGRMDAVALSCGIACVSLALHQGLSDNLYARRHLPAPRLPRIPADMAAAVAITAARVSLFEAQGKRNRRGSDPGADVGRREANGSSKSPVLTVPPRVPFRCRALQRSEGVPRRQ